MCTFFEFSIFIHCRLLAVILSSYCVPSELYLGFHLSFRTYKSIFFDKQSGRIVTDEIDHPLTKEPGTESLTLLFLASQRMIFPSTINNVYVLWIRNG